MSLSDLLQPSAVFVGAAVASRKAALHFMAQRSAALWSLDPAAVETALALREKLGTTGFGGGAAIPHGGVDGLDRLVAMVLRPAQPLDWEALDGRPVELVVMLLGPTDAGAGHLKALARISRVLRDQTQVGKLRGARDAAALWSLLCHDQAAAAA